MAKAPRIGLVLGGGGIAGFAFHSGALAALETVTGWDPRTSEVIVGTSAGAAIASLLRGNVPVSELVDKILSVPTDPEGMAILRRVSGRGQSLIGASSLVPSSVQLVANELQRFHRVRPIRLMTGVLPKGRLATDVLGEQAATLHPKSWPKKSLWIPSVKLGSGDVTVFGRDTTNIDVATAVAASCAIPAFFQPVRINGCDYVDGGVRSMMNADLLSDLDLDLIVAISPMSLNKFGPRSPFASILRSLPKAQLTYELRRLRQAGHSTLLMEPDGVVSRAMGPNPMDPTRVVPVLVGSAMTMTEHVTRLQHKEKLDVLRAAAKYLESPADVPYPD